jgi:RimJ/RimL family protein N-acetyltransferase
VPYTRLWLILLLKMEIETKRLILRQWQDEDYSEFAALNADASVMEFFPRALTHQESDELADRIRSLIEQRGWGFWALELKEKSEFIGFTGLHIPKSILPFSPCVEIGWRLAKRYWGYGYAPEAAREALGVAFNNLQLDEVVSFTSVHNLKSQSVMRKIGMENTNENFLHPDISSDSLLKEHVLFKITRSRWLELT